ncbi:LOW QUALITY PROTEIN: hypothetical protein NC651_029467 [Populus alba x Populus x berolinensis]|nr:LOW QUALITY PROTEIN: hypothetical protein NC651_029467 [Populus alba x Populus x berolinensis]
MKRVFCGSLVHGLAIKRRFMEGFIYVDIALRDMYASCGVGMRDACVVFHDIKEKNVVSWTTLIAGYTHRGNGNRALQIFPLNPHSISIAVRACASIGSQNFGRQIHTAVIKHGFESDLPVTNSILDMCGCLSEANKYFNDMTEKDLITWNTLISRSNINMCECKQLCVVDSKFMEDFSQRGLDRNLELANALIDMYAKCVKCPCRNFWFSWYFYDDWIWSSWITMVKSGIRPDRGSVIWAVLSACPSCVD